MNRMEIFVRQIFHVYTIFAARAILAMVAIWVCGTAVEGRPRPCEYMAKMRPTDKRLQAMDRMMSQSSHHSFCCMLRRQKRRRPTKSAERAASEATTPMSHG